MSATTEPRYDVVNHCDYPTADPDDRYDVINHCDPADVDDDAGTIVHFDPDRDDERDDDA